MGAKPFNTTYSHSFLGGLYLLIIRPLVGVNAVCEIRALWHSTEAIVKTQWRWNSRTAASKNSSVVQFRFASFGFDLHLLTVNITFCGSLSDCGRHIGQKIPSFMSMPTVLRVGKAIYLSCFIHNNGKVVNHSLLASYNSALCGHNHGPTRLKDVLSQVQTTLSVV